MIDLKEFLEGYKTSEIVLGGQKRVFREPSIKDLKMNISDILEKYCIEGNFKEFKKYVFEEIPMSKQNELINKVLEELGLV